MGEQHLRLLENTGGPQVSHHRYKTEFMLHRINFDVVWSASICGKLIGNETARGSAAAGRSEARATTRLPRMLIHIFLLSRKFIAIRDLRQNISTSPNS
jgi:hypothetical protein